MATQKQDSYACVHCGEQCPHLFRQYSEELIEVSKCVRKLHTIHTCNCMSLHKLVVVCSCSVLSLVDCSLPANIQCILSPYWDWCHMNHDFIHSPCFKSDSTTSLGCLNECDWSVLLSVIIIKILLGAPVKTYTCCFCIYTQETCWT